jgi:hypothetical protein
MPVSDLLDSVRRENSREIYCLVVNRVPLERWHEMYTLLSALQLARARSTVMRACQEHHRRDRRLQREVAIEDPGVYCLGWQALSSIENPPGSSP